MSFSVEYIIDFFVIVCVAMLAYNVLFMLCVKNRQREDKKAERWQRRIRGCLRQSTVQEQDKKQKRKADRRHKKRLRKHLRKLRKRLRNVDELVSYNKALQPIMAEETVQAYLFACRDVYLMIAEYYMRRPTMEQACCAIMVSAYLKDAAPEYKNSMSRYLMAYLQKSSVFCRENIMLSLCMLGNASALEQMFHAMNDNNWFHHPRLISDGLMSFAGDRVELARRLWNVSAHWQDFLRVAFVQFASNVSDDLREEFLRELESENCPLEVRYALVRFFRRYPTLCALRPLLAIVRKGADAGGVDAVACMALAAYPGEETVSTLCMAMQSRDWYVRRNAAQSLWDLGCMDAAYKVARQMRDHYMFDMLEYVRETKQRRGAQCRS